MDLLDAYYDVRRGGRWLANLGRPHFGKVEIVHTLTDWHGYRRYLEFATSTTGGKFSRIDRTRFDDCRRLMYRIADTFDDGYPIDYRAPGLDISEPLRAMKADRVSFDIMLVDTYHSYEHSLRDLQVAFALLEPGGAMVVHDCLPTSARMATPQYVHGAWCGLTCLAFVDFVLGREDIRYATVDCDYGCGVIRKVEQAPKAANRTRERQQQTIAIWQALPRGQLADKWRLFQRDYRMLLNLISPREFRRRRCP
jgi:hypothetical protein